MKYFLLLPLHYMHALHVESSFVGVLFDSSDEGGGSVFGDSIVEVSFSSLHDSDGGVAMLGLEFEMSCAFGANLTRLGDDESVDQECGFWISFTERAEEMDISHTFVVEFVCVYFGVYRDGEFIVRGEIGSTIRLEVTEEVVELV